MNKVNIKDLGIIDLEQQSLDDLKKLIKKVRAIRSLTRRMLIDVKKDLANKDHSSLDLRVRGALSKSLPDYSSNESVLIDAFKEKALASDIDDNVTYSVIHVNVEECPELGHTISTEVVSNLNAVELIFYIHNNYRTLSDIQMSLEFYDVLNILEFNCDAKKTYTLDYSDLQNIVLEQDLEFLVGL